MKKSLIKTLKENTRESTIDEYLSPIIKKFKFSLIDETHTYGFENTLNSKKRTNIKEYVKHYSNFKNEFDDLIPSYENKEKYREIIWEILSYELNYEGTGIILAGYGLKSNNPSFIEINLHCNDNGKIIYDHIDCEIDSEESKLKIFAINNEGYTFITGVNEEFIEYISQYIRTRNRIALDNILEDLKENNIENGLGNVNIDVPEDEFLSSMGKELEKKKSKEAIQRLLDERTRINAEKREEYRKKHFKNYKKNS